MNILRRAKPSNNGAKPDTQPRVHERSQNALWVRSRVHEAQIRALEHRLELLERWRNSLASQVSRLKAAEVKSVPPESPYAGLRPGQSLGTRHG